MNTTKIDFTKPIELTDGRPARLLADNVDGEFKFAVAYPDKTRGSGEKLIRSNEFGVTRVTSVRLRNKVTLLGWPDLKAGEAYSLDCEENAWNGAVGVFYRAIGEQGRQFDQLVMLVQSPKGYPFKGQGWPRSMYANLRFKPAVVDIKVVS